MAAHDEWPASVVDLMRSASIAQYTTVSAAGVPIDTPVLLFPSDGLETFDLATGLSYPAKAERARRNARTSLLIEGSSNEPVILISGFAAVRDADLQANAMRYLAEAGHTLPHDPPWELARQAIWYWTRIFVRIKPARVLWWDTPSAMHQPPHRWHAPESTEYPASDPVRPGIASKAATWEEHSSWARTGGTRTCAQRARSSVVDGYGGIPAVDSHDVRRARP